MRLEAWRWWLLLGILIAAALLALDPYSGGRIGGEHVNFGPRMEDVPVHRWQIWGTLALVALLIAAAVFAIRQRYRNLFASLAAETVLFLMFNVIYVLRDSMEIRGYVGYELAPTPLRATAAGLAVRIALLVGVVWVIRHRRSVMAQPSVV